VRSAARVSCHYLVTKTGELGAHGAREAPRLACGPQLLARHHDVNDDSIGIELDNPGHTNGYEPFPDAQIEALIPLVSDIMQRHRITRGNVVGHSDIAPAPQARPGELFPWAGSRACASRCRGRPAI
jgi:N-acetylmuramoyl-L-alanine amidase